MSGSCLFNQLRLVACLERQHNLKRWTAQDKAMLDHCMHDWISLIRFERMLSNYTSTGSNDNMVLLAQLKTLGGQLQHKQYSTA